MSAQIIEFPTKFASPERRKAIEDSAASHEGEERAKVQRLVAWLWMDRIRRGKIDAFV